MSRIFYYLITFIIISFHVSNISCWSNDFFNDSRAEYPADNFDCDHRSGLSAIGGQGCYDFDDAVKAVKQLYPKRITYECGSLDIQRCEKSPYPFKSKEAIQLSTLTWSNITIIAIAYDTNDFRFLKLSLHQIPTQFQGVLDIVLVSDTCFPSKRLNETEPATSLDNRFHSEFDEDPLCRDHVHEQVVHISKIRNNIRIKIVRVNPCGDLTFYTRNCKTVIGMSKVYEMYPEKRYYFKVDLDSIIYLRRFINFINTVDSVTDPTVPLYIGQATESLTSDKLHFYSNGGNGYAFNNIAMQKMAARIHCKYPGKAEDGVMGCRFYNLFPSNGRLLTGGSTCFGYPPLTSLTFHGTPDHWYDKVIDSVHAATHEDY